MPSVQMRLLGLTQAQQMQWIKLRTSESTVNGINMTLQYPAFVELGSNPLVLSYLIRACRDCQDLSTASRMPLYIGALQLLLHEHDASKVFGQFMAIVEY